VAKPEREGVAANTLEHSYLIRPARMLRCLSSTVSLCSRAFVRITGAVGDANPAGLFAFYSENRVKSEYGVLYNAAKLTSRRMGSGRLPQVGAGGVDRCGLRRGARLITQDGRLVKVARFLEKHGAKLGHVLSLLILSILGLVFSLRSCSGSRRHTQQ
jgi:hypothetical protein